MQLVCGVGDQRIATEAGGIDQKPSSSKNQFFKFSCFSAAASMIKGEHTLMLACLSWFHAQDMMLEKGSRDTLNLLSRAAALLSAESLQRPRQQQAQAAPSTATADGDARWSNGSLSSAVQVVRPLAATRGDGLLKASP